MQGVSCKAASGPRQSAAMRQRLRAIAVFPLPVRKRSSPGLPTSATRRCCGKPRTPLGCPLSAAKQDIENKRPQAVSSHVNWVRFVIRAWRSSTYRRGCFAVLIWLLEQSRSGGGLPLVAPACRPDGQPTDQHVVLIRDKGVIRPAFLYRFEVDLGHVFFCYQLLTSSIFFVIGKWRAEQELTLLPSPNPSHGGSQGSG